MTETPVQHATTGGALSYPPDPPLPPAEVELLTTQRRGYLMLVAAINKRLGQETCPVCGKRRDK